MYGDIQNVFNVAKSSSRLDCVCVYVYHNKGDWYAKHFKATKGLKKIMYFKAC